MGADRPDWSDRADGIGIGAGARDAARVPGRPPDTVTLTAELQTANGAIGEGQGWRE